MVRVHGNCLRNDLRRRGSQLIQSNYVRTAQTETEAALSVLEGGG